MIVVSVIDANDQLIECEFEGTPFYIGLSWNEFGQFWSLNVRDLNRQTLASNIALVQNWPLFRQVRRPVLPPGELFVGAAAGHKLNRRSFVDGLAVLVYFDLFDIEQMRADA